MLLSGVYVLVNTLGLNSSVVKELTWFAIVPVDNLLFITVTNIFFVTDNRDYTIPLDKENIEDRLM